MERQLDRIKQAEEAMKQLLEIAAQLRQEIEKAGSSNPDQIIELREAAEGLERQARELKDSLRDWREEIN
jgi:FtsZ-binding cell division protein ZapB